MPTRDTAPVGAPIWIDLMASDVARSRAFYCSLFGWETEAPNEDLGGYLNFTREGVRVAGCVGARPGSSAPDVWSVYLASADAARTVTAVAIHGGHPLVGATSVADLGIMALATDPGGAPVGIWQPRNFHGFGVLGEAGAPAWFELSTPDYDGAVVFYRDAFGWDTHVASDTGELRYTTLGTDDSALAGIMDASGSLPEGARGQWSIYFGVDDADKALALVVDLGGTVEQAAEDTPFGRLASVADPAGAGFKLIQAG
jgi:predicted enzyme related to lactoylglutathione lyase